MAIAPLGEPARPAYTRLREIAEMVRSAHPGAQVISAGMSGDLGDAIAEGATHVRIGTALLGGRRAFVR
jgi:PLP dependent protein